MVDVTRDNFNELYPEVEKAIADALFLAIDCEFTGLYAEGTSRLSPYDSLQMYYNRARQAAMKFIICQFGLTAVLWDAETEKHIVRTYNFYIFPHSTHRSMDVRFSCQSSSIAFLARHGIDFNTIFKSGISYMTYEQEEKLRVSLERKEIDQDTNLVQLGPAEEEFLAGIYESIENWLQSSSEPTLPLPKCTSFRRRIIYQEVKRKYPTGVLCKSGKTEQGDPIVVVHRATVEERDAEQAERVRRREREVESSIGFRRVLDAIRKHQKLVVGHNSLLDIVHTIEHFCTHLPESISDFKSTAVNVLPFVLDTKYMATVHDAFKSLNSTALEDLAAQLEATETFGIPPVEFAAGHDKYRPKDDGEGKQSFHEAGYDSFMTAKCFLGLARALEPATLASQDVLRSVIAPFVNRIHVMRLAHVDHINLVGAETHQSLAHVTVVGNIPSSWKSSNLAAVVKGVGQTQIDWIDESRAYLAVQDRDRVQDARAMLQAAGLEVLPMVATEALNHLSSTAPLPAATASAAAAAAGAAAAAASAAATAPAPASAAPPATGNADEIPLDDDEEGGEQNDSASKRLRMDPTSKNT